MSSTSEGNPSQRPLGLRLVPGNSETSVEQLPHKLLYTQHPSPGVLPRRNSHTECANTMVHLGRDSLNLTILTTFIVSPSGLVPRGILGIYWLKAPQTCTLELQAKVRSTIGVGHTINLSFLERAGISPYILLFHVPHKQKLVPSFVLGAPIYSSQVQDSYGIHECVLSLKLPKAYVRAKVLYSTIDLVEGWSGILTKRSTLQDLTPRAALYWWGYRFHKV